MEIALLGRGAQRLEVVSAEAGDAAGGLLRRPGLHREGRLAGDGGQAQLLAGPRGLDHLPAVAGRGVGVDDDRSGGAEPGRHLELVVPAAVVEPALAGEGLRVALRVVVHHEQDAALQVGPLVVVPALLRGHDAVAHEHDLGVVHAGFRGLRPRERDVVLVESQVRAGRASRNAQHLGTGGGHADEVESLLPAPPRGPGLEPDRLEARGEVLAGEAIASRRGAAPFQQVAREEADVGAHPVFTDGGGGGPLLVGQESRPDCGQSGSGQGGQGARQQQPHRFAPPELFSRRISSDVSYYAV